MTGVGGGGEGEVDVNNFGQSWGRVRHGVHYGIQHGQRHEAKAGRVSGHSWAEAGIGTGKVQVRSCSCSEACLAGAGNTKMAQDVGKAIVGPACVPH